MTSTVPPAAPGTVSLARRAEQAAARFEDHRALLFEGSWLSSDQLASRERRAAAGLLSQGVRPGDRVVLCMANCPEVAVAYRALWRAGAVPTPVLFLLSEDELRHVLHDSGAVLAVTTPEFLPKVRAAGPSLPVVVVTGPDSAVIEGELGLINWRELEAGGEAGLVDRDPGELAALLYTGGTTGRSKGVALTHAGLDRSGFLAAEGAREPGRTRSLLPLPLAHVYGLMVSVAGMHATEPTESVLMRWFDAAGFVALVEQHRTQSASLVPSMIAMLLAQPLEQHDLSCLERIGSGGAPLAPELARELERRLPGVEVREGYGCTETSALISTQPAVRRLGSVGMPVAGVRVRIAGPDGAGVPAGVDGEICVSGPVLMHGYWKDPEATAAAVVDGELRTGDVGHLDEDGYLWVVDRIKDLVIRSGVNVYPRDVEDVLLAHPEITAAAVVGRPDPRTGEEVVAFVSTAAGSALTPDEVVGYAREHLSAAKYPREVHLVEAIPLTSALKTDRKALRARVAGP